MATEPPPASALDPGVWQLWGKADPARVAPGATAWHPLLCHLLDVAACAERLLLDVRTDRLRALSSTLGLPDDAALAWARFFVGLHDVGKATPGFQAKYLPRRSDLAAVGLDFTAGAEPHGSLSVSLATKVLADHGVPMPLARAIARSVGAHHGEFVPLPTLTSLEREKGLLLPAHAGKAPLWAVLRERLGKALAEACGVVATLPRPSLPDSVAARNALVADLAGLTTVADWLGSNADVFAYIEPPTSAAGYLGEARKKATQVLDMAGWRRPPRSPSRPFTSLFGGKTPWPLHEAVEQLTPQPETPSLIVVEAPMGEGKTESALVIFDRLAARGASGLYVALPTQATSNQLFGRVARFMQEAFPEEVHGLHLIHGDAGLSERYDALKEQARAFAARSIDGVAGRDGGPIADAWFARSKRTLLAPLGVGTLDQALLGVLGVRHGFLRLHGLAGKVVVVDEVHAYDTYTSTLLDRLLAWLHALGTTVVLLSATLPARRRDALLAAFGAAPCRPAPYPRLTVASGGAATSRHVDARRPPVAVTIRWESRTSLPERLAEAMAGGGCVAWIVNTVGEAQRTYLELKALRQGGGLAADVDLGLIHARFPFAARQAREQAAELAFGPGPGRRPRAAILVGTQVLEQSLDLDFDLMVSELAPVDLVLQRAGRLHRHARQDRPARLVSPELWLVPPEDEEREGGPTFGPSSHVYSELVLLRTWLALRERAHVMLPTDIETLVETVYGSDTTPRPSALAARLVSLQTEYDEARLAEESQARSAGLLGPEEGEPFNYLVQVRDDEDPTVHRELRAVTRLGGPSIEVVPIGERDARTVLASAPDVALDLVARAEAPRDVVIAAARQTVRITHGRVVAALLCQPVPPAFQASGHLRFHRVLRLDGNGRTEVGGVPLTLHPDLGLVVGRLEGEDESEAVMENLA
jgi:CRISPR-associated endonuclease/helicase Cas3